MIFLKITVCVAEEAILFGCHRLIETVLYAIWTKVAVKDDSCEVLAPSASKKCFALTPTSSLLSAAPVADVSFHLIGGATPTGPAIAGEIEMSKHLPKAIQMMVYDFNSSDQMDIRREDRNRPEDAVLMLDLRDFQPQKIVIEDTPIFLGLIRDLCSAQDVPRKLDLEFEKQVRQVTIYLKLQPDDNLDLKVVKLVELLEVRHSVFIIGLAGTGKSEMCKTLYRTYTNLKFKPYINAMEPKAVTNDKSLGVISPPTREWVDGLLSYLIRDESQMSGDGFKLMLNDGNMDPINIRSSRSVFKNFIDPGSKQLLPWSDLNLVSSVELNPDISLQKKLTIINTIQRTRTRYFLDLLDGKKKEIMLVGATGTGKSVIINDKVKSFSNDLYTVPNELVNFNTASGLLQKILEKPLEKKARRNFGPPGGKTLINVIDDINMTEVDPYGTVQSHTLNRQQFMDNYHWYDRTKSYLKDVQNVMFAFGMSPAAECFILNPLMQRNFYVFALRFPSHDTLFAIHSSILTRQLLNNTVNKYNSTELKLGDIIVQLEINFHADIFSVFSPTDIKFHYIFNLRDMSNVFQGKMFTTGKCISTNSSFSRLCRIHETSQIYSHKSIEQKHQDTFSKTTTENLNKLFSNLVVEDIDPENEYSISSLIYSHFADGIGDQVPMIVLLFLTLKKLLNNTMMSYNEFLWATNLVRFDEATLQVCQIYRTLEIPRSVSPNASFVGFVGSGIQSLINSQVQWEYLTCLFGEIVHGGHITEDWARRLCLTHLKVNVNPDETRNGHSEQSELKINTNKILPNPMKKFAVDFRRLHPSMVLDQLIPGMEPHYTILSRLPSIIQVRCIIDGVEYCGRGSTKKEAKKYMSIGAIHYIYGYNYLL